MSFIPLAANGEREYPWGMLAPREPVEKAYVGLFHTDYGRAYVPAAAENKARLKEIKVVEDEWLFWEAVRSAAKARMEQNPRLTDMLARTWPHPFDTVDAVLRSFLSHARALARRDVLAGEGVPPQERRKVWRGLVEAYFRKPDSLPPDGTNAWTLTAFATRTLAAKVARARPRDLENPTPPDLPLAEWPAEIVRQFSTRLYEERLRDFQDNLLSDAFERLALSAYPRLTPTQRAKAVLQAREEAGDVSAVSRRLYDAWGRGKVPDPKTKHPDRNLLDRAASGARAQIRPGEQFSPENVYGVGATATAELQPIAVPHELSFVGGPVKMDGVVFDHPYAYAQWVVIRRMYADFPPAEINGRVTEEAGAIYRRMRDEWYDAVLLENVRQEIRDWTQRDRAVADLLRASGNSRLMWDDPTDPLLSAHLGVILEERREEIRNDPPNPAPLSKVNMMANSFFAFWAWHWAESFRKLAKVGGQHAAALLGVEPKPRRPPSEDEVPLAWAAPSLAWTLLVNAYDAVYAGRPAGISIEHAVAVWLDAVAVVGSFDQFTAYNRLNRFLEVRAPDLLPKAPAVTEVLRGNPQLMANVLLKDPRESFEI